jgi:hypothetical protein
LETVTAKQKPKSNAKLSCAEETRKLFDVTKREDDDSELTRVELNRRIARKERVKLTR